MCIWAYIYSVFHCARVGVLYICLYICAYASMAYKYVIVLHWRYIVGHWPYLLCCYITLHIKIFLCIYYKKIMHY